MAKTEDDDDPRSWIRADESASTMLSRVLSRRPFVLLPPLHRVPLRVGNVVEIVGPSPSAKSQVLLQAAVQCVLPKEWKGIHFGGLERIAVYVDLDCRFDVLRLVQILQNRIRQVFGSESHADDELFLDCMRRFLYIRCYSSSEFVDSLKTLHLRIQDASEALGVGIHFLMIDSIGAFYWMDRLTSSPALGDFRRNCQSFQNLMETMVQETRRLLELQPMLVLTTKSSIFGIGASVNSQRTLGKCPQNDAVPALSLDAEKILYREYMPTVWQAFVTHRIHLQVSGPSRHPTGACDNMTSMGETLVLPVYTSEWVKPLLNINDRFSVTDGGIILSM